MTAKVDTSGGTVFCGDVSSTGKVQDCVYDESFDSVHNEKCRSALGANKKKLHPLLGGPVRRDTRYVSIQTASKTNLSEFTRRIMSAKLLRMNHLQNQLTETQIQLSELLSENKILKNLQKRQEGALKKYEGNHAELPQLIRSHNEEIRTLKNTNKILKAQLREANGKLKDRDAELEILKENHSKLKKLSSEKNLLERDKLQRKVETLDDVIREQDDKMQILSRKILLESKNYRHHLNMELNKHRETQKELNNALAMISKLEGQLLSKEKITVATSSARFTMRRQQKSFPPITNKHQEIPSSVATQDDDHDDTFESPDSDSEILGRLLSSEDSPSPTQDIFPDIIHSKAGSQLAQLPKNTDGLFHFECDLPLKQCTGLKPSSVQVFKRNSQSESDVEQNAKLVIEKLTDNLDGLERDATTLHTNQISMQSMYNETKANLSNLDTQLVQTLNREHDQRENRITITDLTRTVAKRKRNEEKQEKATGQEQQKLINVTKSWNDIKNKIEEDRVKADAKMKELCQDSPDRARAGHTDTKYTTVIKQGKAKDSKELLFTNFTQDEYIITELEKTDKIFRKLRGDTRTKPALVKSNSLGQRTETPVPKSNSVESCPLPEMSRSGSRQQVIQEDATEKQHKQQVPKTKQLVDAESAEESDIEDETDKTFSEENINHMPEKAQKLTTQLTTRQTQQTQHCGQSGASAVERNGGFAFNLSNIDAISAD